MNFTINVQVTGLEGLCSIIERLVSGNAQVSVTPTTNGVVPGPVVNSAPVAPQQAPAIAPTQIQPQPVAAPVQYQPQPQPVAAVPVQNPSYGAPAPAAPVAPVPTVAPTYTIDQLAVAATQLMDAGRKNELISLLSAFGVPALTELPKEHYGAFVTQLRSMGAKI
jgi:uncharacterized membrane protein